MLLPDGSTQPLTEAGRRAILSAVNKMADGALRCLALAHKVCGPAWEWVELSRAMHSVHRHGSVVMLILETAERPEMSSAQCVGHELWEWCSAWWFEDCPTGSPRLDHRMTQCATVGSVLTGPCGTAATPPTLRSIGSVCSRSPHLRA